LTDSRLRGKTAPGGSLLVFAGLIVGLALAIRGHPVVILSLAALGALLAYLYLYHADASRKKWLPEEWQMRIPVRHSEMRPGEVDRIRRYFTEDENEILWISHQHVLFLLSRIWFPCMLAVVWLAFTAFIGDIRIPLHSDSAGNSIRHYLNAHTQTNPSQPVPQAKIHIRQPAIIHWPHALTLPWWVVVMPAVLFTLVAVLVWAGWSSWYFIVTDRRVIAMQRPYSLLPFMNALNDPFFWSEIDNAEIRGSDFRRRWGLAVIDISTKLQGSEDWAIKNILGLPHPDEVAELINHQVQEHKVALENDDLRQSMVELTSAIRELPGRLGIQRPQDDWPTQEM